MAVLSFYWLNDLEAGFAYIVSRGPNRGRADRDVLKLTVDSSEPLEDALRVVGALYGLFIVKGVAPGPGVVTG